MSVKSLLEIEGYFYAIFATKTRQKLHFTSIISSVKSLYNVQGSAPLQHFVRSF